VTIEITEEPMSALPEYARVPIVFTVDSVFNVVRCDDRPDGIVLSERYLEVPHHKDYDAIAGEGPLHWTRFDLSKWALFTARLANRIVGGATVAFDTPGLTMLEGRRQGVGSALFQRVETWAKLHGCRGIS
jgi:GNAT superfamily N-acetyltransferase